MKVDVDDELCAGHGVCAGLCPDVFTIDDDEGFARVVVDLVPPEHYDVVRQAAERCPARAITMSDDPGR